MSVVRSTPRRSNSVGPGNFIRVGRQVPGLDVSFFGTFYKSRTFGRPSVEVGRETFHGDEKKTNVRFAASEKWNNINLRRSDRPI